MEKKTRFLPRDLGRSIREQGKIIAIVVYPPREIPLALWEAAEEIVIPWRQIKRSA